MQKLFWIVSCLLLSSYAAVAQRVNLSGTIIEKETGEPLSGANIYFKGTTIGTATDGEGNFQIKNIKTDDYELVISCMGYAEITDIINMVNDISGKQYYLEKSNSELGEVVITGTATPHRLKNAPVQTELINLSLIKQIAPSNFNDLMAGVSPSFDFSPMSMGPFVRLNGLGNDHILVMIDGKRIYGDVGGQNDLNRINPAGIDRIEIVKGASSALYGSEAIAGVINIITKKSDNRVHISNNSRIGSYNEWIQNNSIDLNFGRFSSSTSYDRKQTGGWQLSPYEVDKNGNLVKTDALVQNPSTDFTLNQMFTYAPLQKLSLYLQGSNYENDSERPKTVTKYGFFYTDFSYSAGAKYLLNDTNHIQIDWSSDNFKYYYKYNQDYSDYRTGDKLLQTDQLRNALNVKGLFSLSKSNLLTVGGEYVNEELESAGRLVGETASAYTLAAYAQDEIAIVKNLSVVAGLRFVQHKEFGNAFTPKISTLYKINDFNLRATYARGFKAPTLKELYYRYYYERAGTLYLGNPDLDAQTSDYYGASVEYMIRKLSVSLSGYRNDVNSLIDYQTVETLEEDAANGIKITRKHYNISEARTRGIDLIFNVKLGNDFTVGGGYSLVDAINRTENIRLESVAKNYGNARVGYRHDWKSYQLSASLSGRFQDEKFYDNGNARGYSLWKLTTSHRFEIRRPFRLEATAGVDNIFNYKDDSPYGSHYGTISPGRTFFLGINIEFIH